MKVTCTGRRVTLKPSFIENAEKRLAKLDKFFPDEAQAQVTVTVEKSGQTVEIMLRSKDLAMRAEKTDERMEDALADAVDLLTRRVVKYRKRLGTKLTAAAAEIPATEPEESMDIVREKHFALKPCSTEEAILQMDLLGHSFFLYHSTENDKIQVVYRRADGGYGVLMEQLPGKHTATAACQSYTTSMRRTNGITLPPLLRGGIFYLFCMVQGKPCCLAPAGHAGFALCLRRIQRLICLGFSGSIGQVARAANSSWPVPGLYCGTRPCSAMLNQSVGVKIT